MATYESRRYNTPVPDASKIADGSVDNTEFQHLDGVTSDIQTQMNARLPLAGGTVTGNVIFNDNASVYVGTGQDARIFHDGSNTTIKNDTGALKVLADTLQLKNNADDETLATFANGGAASLRFNNSTKLETTNTGVTVTGTLAGNIDGASITSGTIPSARVSGIARAVNSSTILDLVPPSVNATGTSPIVQFGSSQTGASVTVDVTNIDYVTLAFGMQTWIASSPTGQNYNTSFTSAQIRVERSGSAVHSDYFPKEDSFKLIDEYFSAGNPGLFQRKPVHLNFVFEEDVSGLSGNVTYQNDMRAVAGVALSGAYTNGNYSTTASFSGRGTSLFDVRSYCNWIQVTGH